jgi:hypothetical protein
MTLLTKGSSQPAIAATDRADSPEALFPEAEHHRRFRRTRLAVLAAMLAVAAVAYFVTAAVTSTPPPPVQLAAQAFAHSAISATESADTARISFTSEEQPRPTLGCAKTVLELRGPHVAARAVVTTFRGEIDFATSTLSLAGTSTTCGSKTPPCSFPSQRILTTTAQYISTAHQDASCLTASTGPRKEVIGRGPVASKPWSQVPATELAETVSVDDLLVSARPLAAVAVLQGRVTKLGSSEVNGTPATEYTGTTTLADIQRIVGYHPKLTSRQGSLTPASTSIRVDETIWLDARGRVIQLVTSEPLFTVIARHGGVSGDAQVFSTMVEHGARLFQHDYELARLDLSNFGAPVHITVPPQSEVSHPLR